MKKVLVDIYGADIGANAIIKGALKSLLNNAELELCFLGEQELILKVAKENNADLDRISVIDTADFVTNNENPVNVIKGREETTLVKGIEELKANPNTIGFITAGSTGALLLASIFRLGLVGGLKTPALCSVIPCCDGKMMAILDCGANIDCRSTDLVNYALMGDALMKCLGNATNPKVALLSVGREDTKGNKLTLEAFEKLSKLPINFVGNMEGLDAVSGEIDVVVADGFSGNILLKTIEAVGKSAILALDDELKKEKSNEGLLRVKQRMENAYDFNQRGGATFLGTKKPIIKMHGSATEFTPQSCIEQLLKMEKANYQSAIENSLNTIKD